MTPRQLLAYAHGQLAGPDEAHWRSAVRSGYYAAFHDGRALFRTLRFRVPVDASAHGYMSDRLQNAGLAAWAKAGDLLGDFRVARNEADYDLTIAFGVVWAERWLDEVDDYFDLLDDLRADPDTFAAVAAMRAHDLTRGPSTYFGP